MYSRATFDPAHLCAAFLSWTEFGKERRRQLSLLKRAAMRMAHRRLAQVLDAWRRVISGSSERRETNFRNAANMMRHPMLTKVFLAWAGLIKQASGSEAKVRKAINMWRSRLLLQAYKAWEQVAASGLALRRKALARLTKATLAAAFGAWVSAIQHRLHVHRLLRGAVNRMNNR